VKRKILLQHDILKRKTDLRFSAKPKKKGTKQNKRNQTTDLLQELQNCIKVIMSLGHLTGSVRR